MSNDQPIGSVVPPGRSVAMRMARTATASSARRSTLMARSGAMIEERSALHGEVFPGVTAVEQRPLELPVRVAVPLFAVCPDCAEDVMAIACGTDDAFPD